MDPISPALRINDKRKNQSMKKYFFQALQEVINGKKITRASWPNGETISLHNRFLSIKKDDGTIHPLLVSEGDLKGDDWVVIDKLN